MIQLSDSPEPLVRNFFAAWAAIKSELAKQLRAVGGVTVDVKSLVSDGATVMVEQVSNSRIGGTPISAVVMAVFELDAERRISQWREATT